MATGIIRHIGRAGWLRIWLALAGGLGLAAAATPAAAQPVAASRKTKPFTLLPWGSGWHHW